MLELLDWVLGKAAGIVGIFILAILLLCGFIGILKLIDYFNTPTFPWGAVIFLVVTTVSPLIYIISVYRNKTLTKEQKKQKIWGPYY